MAETTYLEAIRQALFEEMDRDPAVVLLGEDVGVYGGAFKAIGGPARAVRMGARDRHADQRVRDCGRGHGHGLRGAAAGRGNAIHRFHRLLLRTRSPILRRSRTTCWGAPVPMVLRGPCGGGVHGGPFHSANPEMYFVHTPGLKVVCPATAHDAKGLLKSAIRDNNPVLFFEHKFLYRRIKEDLPEERLHGADRKSRGAARRRAT